jgi:hypothetical protein
MIGVVAVELLADQDRGFFAGELPVSVGVEVCQDGLSLLPCLSWILLTGDRRAGA